MQETAHLLIPKAPFRRLVKEIIEELLNPGETLRIQSAALDALQEVSESYIVEVFQESVHCAVHAKRSTLIVEDMHLSMILTKKKDLPQLQDDE